MANVARVLRNFQITLPKPVRKRFGVKEGDLIKVEEREGGIFITPIETIDRAQAWFWTNEWQAGEKGVDQESHRGKRKSFKDVDKFIADLKK